MATAPPTSVETIRHAWVDGRPTRIAGGRDRLACRLGMSVAVFLAAIAAAPGIPAAQRGDGADAAQGKKNASQVTPAASLPSAEAGGTRAASRSLTLSQRGILSLDYKAPSSAVILRTVPNGEGVEYTIWFPDTPNSVFLESRAEPRMGTGAMGGLPLVPGDTFALKFTLLSPPSPTPSAAYVLAETIINLKTSSGAYGNAVSIGGGRENSAVSRVSTDDTVTKTIGFTVSIDPAYPPAWSASGDLVRLLVEPAFGALPLEPRVFDEPAQQGYRDRAIGENLTLSKDELLALDYTRNPKLASIVSAIPRGDGVEYTIAFTGKTAGLTLESSDAGGAGALVGLPLSSRDSLALRFTLLSNSAGPQAFLGVGTIINLGEGHGWGFRGRALSASRNPVVAETASGATLTKVVGFAVSASPDTWPESGGTFHLLVEPAPNAISLPLKRQAQAPAP